MYNVFMRFYTISIHLAANNFDIRTNHFDSISMLFNITNSQPTKMTISLGKKMTEVTCVLAKTYYNSMRKTASFMQRRRFSQ